MKPKQSHNLKASYIPLAERLRPQSILDFTGQEHLLGENKPLRQSIEQGTLHSMILWGPPGTGKTTLARLIAGHMHLHFEKISAVFSGVKEIRAVVAKAKLSTQPTVLFVDEVHRFNKAQQDAFLPYIEDGTLILVGATTENPSFALNAALLSRARVYVLKSLTQEALLVILQRALTDTKVGLGHLCLDFPLDLQKILVRAADGDARRALNLLEILGDFVGEKGIITKEIMQQILQINLNRFDKQGDVFYEQISALHKSVRGFAPDAALYWLCRMLDGGCDPRYIARRVLRMAVEDIGLADPRAVEVALHASEMYERLGSPEGELALAYAVVYIAVAPKSNAIYTAYNAAMMDAKNEGSKDVPLHLRNAPTQLLQSLNFGKDYRYAHHEKDAYAAGQTYFPDGLDDRQYYYPTARGLEAKIAEKLAQLKDLDKKAKG